MISFPFTDIALLHWAPRPDGGLISVSASQGWQEHCAALSLQEGCLTRVAKVSVPFKTGLTQ